MFLVIGAVAWGVPLPKMTLQSPSIPVEGYEMCWPSGLKVHVVRRPGSSVLSVATVVGLDERADSEAIHDTAHLVEHLWFMSRPDGGLSVSEVVSDIDHQGFTYGDGTVVYLSTGATAALEPLLNVEAIRLTDPLRGITAEDVLAAQVLVRSEGVWRHDDGAAEAWTKAAVLSRGDGRSDATPLSEVDALRAYASEAYRPERTTLRIEGDVDPKVVETVLRRVFPATLLKGTNASCAHPPSNPVAEESRGAGHESISLPVSRRIFAFGWELPPGFGGQDALGVMGAHWLETALLEVVGAAPRMGKDPATLLCDYSPGSVASYLVCATPLTDKADATRVADRLRTLLPARWKGELTSDTIEVPRLAAFVDVLDASAGIDDGALAARALYSHHASEGVDQAGPLSRDVGTLTAETLAAWGRRWITPERMSTLTVEPGFADSAPSSAFAAAAVLEAPRRSAWPAPRPALASWSVSVLDNGLDVWTLSFPEPLVYTELVFDRGRDVGDTGTSLAHEITSYVDYPFEPEAFGRLATHVASYVDTGTTTTFGHGLPGNMDLQLYALRMMTTERETWGRPSDMLQKPGVADAVARVFDDWQLLVLQRSLATLFPGHPLGTPEWKHVAATRDLTLADAGRWRSSVFRPERATLLVAGNVRAEIVDREAATYFRSWSPGPPPFPGPPVLPPPPKRTVSAIEAAAALGGLRVICRVSGEGLDDAAVDIAGFLAEQGVSQTLRDRGGLYGVGATVLDLSSQTRLLVLSADVPPADGAAAASALTGVLEVVAGGVSDDLLDWARRAVLARHARATSTARTSLDVASRAAVHGLTLEQLREYPSRVDRVDDAAIGRVMRECAGHEAIAWVGPRTDLPGAVWERMDVVLASVREGW